MQRSKSSSTGPGQGSPSRSTSTSSPSTNKTQSKLFSFFTKVSSSPNKSTSSTSDSTPGIASNGSQKIDLKTNQATSEKQISTSTEKDYVVLHEDGSALVNKRIKIWWSNDEEWYSGVVKNFDAKTNRHVILYDDGEQEILDLQTEKYMLIPEEAPRGMKRQLTEVIELENIVDTDEDDENDIPIVSKRAKKGSKVVLFPKKDDDHDEEEEEEWAESSEEEAEWNSDDDGGGGKDDKEVEWDESEINSIKKPSPKKRKTNQTKTEKKSSKKALSTTASSSTPSSSLPLPLPPTSRPSKTLDVSSNASKVNHLQYIASTPSPTKSRNLTSSPLSTTSSLRGNESPHPISEEFTEGGGGGGGGGGGDENGVGGYGSHDHHTWDFLKKNRKDLSGRTSDHPDFNPRTISFPPSFLKEQTPAMKQWCEVKAQNFDVVLFFKVGKFYELFHMDADIGVAEADLIYMKGTKAHSGFPEVAYGKYASLLVSKGYKVARIEQTETPEMLKDRNRNAGRGGASKVVAREVCSILSKGTRTFCHFDDLTLLDDTLTGDSSSILISICENVININLDHSTNHQNSEAAVEYGVCIVNSVLCTVTLAQFEDDKLRNRLRTLICRYPPTEVLLEFGEVSSETLGVLQLLAPKAARDLLRNDEMPKAELVPDLLRKAKYFRDLSSNDAVDTYPPVLQISLNALSEGASTLVIRALGGALWHLRRCCIDYEVMSHGRIFAYVPPDTETNSSDAALFADLTSQTDSNWSQDSCISMDGTTTADDNNNTSPRHMILDAITLTNLEILVNTFDHTPRGSLFTFMNRCRTPFGKRLLKEWICKPLLRPVDIQNRINAVSELLDNLSSQCESARTLLKSCPDLERLLSRVHSNGISKQQLSHPDSRAIMYENQMYNTRKIKDFAEILRGFDIIVAVVELFQDHSCESQLLKMLLSPSGKFPLQETKKTLAFFRQIFDEKQAKKDGYIRPLAGVDTLYDEAVADVADIERSFEEYLKEQKRATGLTELCYFGTNKDRYQLEVPMAKVSRVPKDWTSKSQKKTHRRYWTSFIETNLASLVQAEEKLALAQKDTMRRVFERFDKNKNIWRAAVSCVGIFDALLSLVSVSSLPNYSWPKIIPRDNQTRSQLDIVGGRHPMLEQSLAERGDTHFISNDLSLGGVLQELDQSQTEDPSSSSCSPVTEYHPQVMLVSGPNMGGKSTLLRQTCLIAIMAQLGCRVPADSCTLTPVDRIFTRIGASDKILTGQSTFFVELSETAMILKHATQDSLCILDELGRGTSTFDGTAIAHAVVDFIVSKIFCRTLFATHYHTLINDWSIDPRIRLGHMDCLVNSDGSNSNGREEVTFLYRLCDGSSPRSYGLNVARLAKLPEEVLSIAYQQSHEFELKMTTTSNSESITGSSENQLRVIIYQFYERLVSILQNMNLQLDENNNSEGVVVRDDMYWVICELWRRYVHMISRTSK